MSRKRKKRQPHRHVPVDPGRVLKKFRECGFFLQMMEQREQNEDEFGFCLSAFLTALKSLSDLIPMADREHKVQLRESIEIIKDDNPDLKYLLGARDAEVHRDGVTLQLSLSTSVRTIRDDSRFARSRLQPRPIGRFHHVRLQSRYGQPHYETVYRHSWRFKDYPVHNITDMSRGCLDSFNPLIEQLFPGWEAVPHGSGIAAEL
jgi:hypothetical protein